ncbi:hypothetical protein [uncultured Methanolobus sp.]|uniref:hypothetical protein n=1 Tax=uncultured Methanolobus sp. TaxID=218300 RepID=UPI0029C6437A|nr:hypothetical protein [uncultured Methanolobus sp.]
MKKNNYHNSSVNIESGNKFQGDTAIGENAQIIKNTHIVDNSKNYEVDADDVTFLKKVSPYLINNYGKEKVGIIAAISLIASIITILSLVNPVISGEKAIPFLPTIPQDYNTLVIGIFFILILIGVTFLNAVYYHSSTKCKKCNQDFAYEPFGKVKVRDIDTVDGTRRTTTKTYKCKFCGDIDKRTTNTLIEKEN